jgi:UDP-GlcNAc:undecaprenyl-phosphate GlcNAc-1-phosphate transferase
MGDGGSYFLGYTIAALSIIGSIKSQIGTAMLIPVLALGVPIFDTLFSPIRRFLLGKKMFLPDNGHIHHALVGLGLSTRKTVLIIYASTLFLGILALYLTSLQNQDVALVLIILGIGIFIFIRKIGYFEYITMDKLYGWLQDITDVSGFTHERRTFLSLQTEASKSESIQELWQNSITMFDKLKFDHAELFLGNYELRITNYEFTKMVWTRDGFSLEDNGDNSHILNIAIPIQNGGNKILGTLKLSKDLKKDPLSSFTLRRVEHLRRTLGATLGKLKHQDDIS